jgi:GxxExxY protein
MNADSTQLDSLSGKVLGAVFAVANTVGAGFPEKVYQRALLRELGLRGMRATAEASFAVIYQGHSVGEYFADLLVEDALVLRGKSLSRSNPQTVPPPTFPAKLR